MKNKEDQGPQLGAAVYVAADPQEMKAYLRELGKQVHMMPPAMPSDAVERALWMAGVKDHEAVAARIRDAAAGSGGLLDLSEVVEMCIRAHRNDARRREEARKAMEDMLKELEAMHRTKPAVEADPVRKFYDHHYRPRWRG